MRQRLEEGSRWPTNMCGWLTIVEDRGCYEVEVIFDDGYTTVAQRGKVLAGEVRSLFIPKYAGVGFLGGTTYNSKHAAFKRWSHMLHRCYDKATQQRHPTYLGCTVVEDWHNFQKYAEWFDRVAWEGCEIDKDILVVGNRVYGPDTCKAVSKEENVINSCAKNYKFINPKGILVEIYNLSKFCRDNFLTSANMHKVLIGERPSHKGWKMQSKN